jgi:hypothetical protein
MCNLRRIYRWMKFELILYKLFSYILSHAITCHVQLVLCNYGVWQLHMSHTTKNQLLMTFANDRICTSVKGGWGRPRGIWQKGANKIT